MRDPDAKTDRVISPLLGIRGASKFAVEALTDSLRDEVSRLGIDVVPFTFVAAAIDCGNQNA